MKKTVEVRYDKLIELRFEIEQDLAKFEHLTMNTYQMGMFAAMSDIAEKLRLAISDIKLIERS